MGIREEEERVRQAKEEKERIEKEAEAIEFFKKLDINNDGILSEEEIMLEIAFDQNNDGMINDEEATFYLSGHESYDQETFVNTGWLLMKQLFSKFENANKNDSIEDADTKKDEFSDDSVDDYDDYDVDEMDETHPNDNEEDEEPDVPENWDDVDRESAPMMK